MGDRNILRAKAVCLLTTLSTLAACSESGPDVAGPAGPTGDGPSVASISLDPAEAELLTGDTLRLEATPSTSSGAPITGVSVSWSSSDNQVATVESTGLVTAVSPGTVTITASAAGTSGTSELSVVEQRVSEDVVVVDSTQLSLTSDSAEFANGILRFQVLGDTSPPVEVGDILVGTENGGFLRRATSVSQADGTVLVQTSTAGLDEVMKLGVFELDLNLQLSPAGAGYIHPTGTSSIHRASEPSYRIQAEDISWGTPELLLLAEGVTFSPGAISLDGLDLCAGLRAGSCPQGVAMLVASGSVAFNPDLNIETEFGFTSAAVQAVASGLLSLDLEVTLNAASAFDTEGERPLATIAVPFVVQAGVPIVGVVRLGLIAGFSANASFATTLQTGVRAQHLTEVGARFAAPGGWEEIFETELGFFDKPTSWSGIGSANARVHVRPEIELDFYSVAAAGIYAEPYVRAEGEVDAPEWRLQVHGGLDAGVDLTFDRILCVWRCDPGTFQRQWHIDEWLLVEQSGTTDSNLVVSIEEPGDGDIFTEGETITFRGIANDAQEGELSADALAWDSSLDGVLGSGSLIHRTDLSVGIHRVTLTATNSRGDSRIDEVEIVVEDADQPEGTISLGDTISGRIETPGDVEEFTFGGQAGQEVAVFLQGLSGSSNDWYDLFLLDRAGNELGRATSRGHHNTLTDGAASQSTGRITLPETATYTIRVQGRNSTTHSGPYRFFPHLVDRAPESVNPAITLGDTISGEAIFPPSDIDEFTFQADAGQEVVVFLQGLSGSSNDWYDLFLLDRAGNELGHATSRGHHDSLTDGSSSQSTGQVTLSETATYTIRVQGRNSTTHSGPYRFHLRAVQGGS